MDALHTAYITSQSVASWAVIVDAKDGVIDFYRKRGFESFPDHENRLFLPMTTVGQTITK